MKIIKIFIISFLLLTGLSGSVLAQCSDSQTELEIKLPGLSECIDGPADYLAGIYKLSLGIGVFLAAMVIVVAGIKYATSGDNSGKQKEAREDIFQAIFGLLILFGSVIILRTINPDLADLGKWGSLPKTEIPKTDEDERTACVNCKNQAADELKSFKMNDSEYLAAKQEYFSSKNDQNAAAVAQQKIRELEDAEWKRVSAGCIKLCEWVPNEEI